MKEIVIKRSTGKFIRMFTLALLLAVLGGVGYAVNTSSYKEICIIACVIFTIIAIYFLIRFLKPKSLLVLSEKGFTDNSSAGGIGFVPWEYVKNISETTVMYQNFISVELKDTSLGCQVINISLDYADTNFYDALNMMQSFFESNKNA